jgi:hypothetical protein
MSPDCHSERVSACGAATAFVAADAMPACILRMNKRVASGMAHFDTMRRTNCMILLLCFQNLYPRPGLKHRIGLSVGHGLRAGM